LLQNKTETEIQNRQYGMFYKNAGEEKQKAC